MSAMCTHSCLKIPHQIEQSGVDGGVILCSVKREGGFAGSVEDNELQCVFIQT